MSFLNELRPAKTAETRRQKKIKQASDRRSNVAAFLFLAPWLLGLVMITAGPVLASLGLSFTDYNLLEAPQWLGLDNYKRMMDDSRLHKSLIVTFTYVAVSVPIQLILALILAIALDKGLKGLAIYRSIYYLPSLLGGSVAIAILWRQIFGSRGLVNQVLGYFGIEGVSWVAHPDYALGTLIILNIWTFGAPMVIFLAGLRQIPEMYYEAAMLDGANRRRQFASVTLPLLTPIIFFNTVLQLIGAFQAFTQSFVVSGGTGGPSDSTLFYTLYLYQKAFANLEMGYASALAWLLLLIIGFFTAANFYFSRFWVFYDD